MSDFFVGIGGTGAKCAEALIHLCAAGLGPDDLWIGFADQDASNGNVDRGNRILKGYGDLYRLLHNPGHHHLGDSSLLRSNLRGVTLPWSPVPDAKNLRELFHFDLLGPSDQTMFDALLHAPSEQRMLLDEGFRGRTAVGAMAVVARTLENEGFWRDVKGAIDTADGDAVNIFLVGSIFGGTGASGLPNLAEQLREAVREKGVEDLVRIGAAFMLPYFTFPPDPDSAGPVAAKSEAFLEQARGALHYYATRLETERKLGRRIFDELYVLGWNPLLHLPHYAPGSGAQKNPPLIPELHAALAAARFFRQKGNGDVHYVGRTVRGEGGDVTWKELPAPAPGPDGDVKRNLGQLIRFAFALKYVYAPCLIRVPRRSIRSQAWFQRLIETSSVRLSRDAEQKIVGKLTEYSDELLRWIASLTYSSRTPHGDVQLTGAHLFADEPTASDTGDPDAAFARVRETARPQDLDGFPDLVTDGPAASLADVFAELCRTLRPEESIGLGGFCASLYESSRIDSARG